MQTARQEHRPGVQGITDAPAGGPVVRAASAAQLLHRQAGVAAVQQQRVHPRCGRFGLLNRRFALHVDHLHQPRVRAQLAQALQLLVRHMVHQLQGGGAQAGMLLGDGLCTGAGGKQKGIDAG
jgi:hypothetical protein